MPAPLTDLPMLEAMLFQEAYIADCEGDAAECLEQALDLADFGYQVVWEPEALVLRHLYTGMEMRWRHDATIRPR